MGAKSEINYGDFYNYGSGASAVDLTQRSNLPDTDSIDFYRGTENPIDFSVDTAAQVWGENWRIPTKAQMEELLANTTHEYVVSYKNTEVPGMVFTGTNGKVLFFPCDQECPDFTPTGEFSETGSYLTSYPDKDFGCYALFFGPDDIYIGDESRTYLYQVRPVMK